MPGASSLPRFEQNGTRNSQSNERRQMTVMSGSCLLREHLLLTNFTHIIFRVFINVTAPCFSYTVLGENGCNEWKAQWQPGLRPPTSLDIGCSKGPFLDYHVGYFKSRRIRISSISKEAYSAPLKRNHETHDGQGVPKEWRIADPVIQTYKSVFIPCHRLEKSDEKNRREDQLPVETRAVPQRFASRPQRLLPK